VTLAAGHQACAAGAACGRRGGRGRALCHNPLPGLFLTLGATRQRGAAGADRGRRGRARAQRGRPDARRSGRRVRMGRGRGVRGARAGDRGPTGAGGGLARAAGGAARMHRAHGALPYPTLPYPALMASRGEPASASLAAPRGARQNRSAGQRARPGCLGVRPPQPRCSTLSEQERAFAWPEHHGPTAAAGRPAAGRGRCAARCARWRPSRCWRPARGGTRPRGRAARCRCR